MMTGGVSDMRVKRPDDTTHRATLPPFPAIANLSPDQRRFYGAHKDSKCPRGQAMLSEIMNILNSTPYATTRSVLLDSPRRCGTLNTSKIQMQEVKTVQPRYEDPSRQIAAHFGDAFEILDALVANVDQEQGMFDMIFTDPPYFLSNGGITCVNGKMVKVDKGAWDKSRGVDVNHQFNLDWLKKCQALLKPNGTIWVSGTHHVIFSVGFGMEKLGFKLLNHITWEKPNPPPNLSCRYFTHSTESIIWAGKNADTKHLFNYKEMRQTNNGKQMKSVWRLEAESGEISSLWHLPAPKKEEKLHGKHPTQKPLALVERCILAATNPGDSVLDPFMGSGTTGVACARIGRSFTGIEADEAHFQLALKRFQDKALPKSFKE